MSPTFTQDLLTVGWVMCSGEWAWSLSLGKTFHSSDTLTNETITDFQKPHKSQELLPRICSLYAGYFVVGSGPGASPLDRQISLI